MTQRRVIAVAVPLGLMALVLSTAAHGQRREGTTKTEQLEVAFDSPVRFDKIVVPKGRFRVSVTAKGLSFVNPKTMVPVATIPALEKQLRRSKTRPSAVVTKKKAVVEIVVKIRNKLYYAKGVVDDQQPQKRSIKLIGRSDASLGDVLPEEKSERELVELALAKRYLREVKHCGEQADRSHWTTDDRRFWNCVCPITERWRLPQVASDLQVHHFLVKRRSGMTLTVNPKGRVADCRVWVGAEPPAQPDADTSSASQSGSTVESSE